MRPLSTVGILVLVLSAAVAVVVYAQGMATPRRAAKAPVMIETDLPPIQVDFRDLAVEAGLTGKVVSGGETSKKYILEATGTGVAIFDYDNDGWMDVFVVNATRFEGESGSPAPISHLYRNLGKLKFEDVTLKAGLAKTGWGQGAVARVYVYAAGRRLSGEVQSGSSFLSQNDPRLHFGLGSSAAYDRIEVLWPGGSREVFPGEKASQMVTLWQGSNKKLAAPRPPGP